ncbi:MAG: hypothetical protein ACT4PP_05485 [Sporichthyaceae bacterium]
MNHIRRFRLVAVAAGLGLAAGALAIAGGTSSAGASAPTAAAIGGEAHPADVAVLGWQYIPSTVRIPRGTTFTFGNYDVVQGIPSHSIDELIPGCTAPPYTSDARKCPRTRFSSGLTDWTLVNTVRGTDKLPVGTYGFVCQVHPFMRGTLVVE